MVLERSLILFVFGVICLVIYAKCMGTSSVSMNANGHNGHTNENGHNGHNAKCEPDCPLCPYVMLDPHQSEMYHDLKSCFSKDYQHPKQKQKVRFVEPTTDFTRVQPFDPENLLLQTRNVNEALSHRNPVSDTNLEGMNDIAKYFQVSLDDPDGDKFQNCDGRNPYMSYHGTNTQHCKDNVLNRRTAHPDLKAHGLGWGGIRH